MVKNAYNPFNDYFYKYVVNITDTEKNQLRLFLNNNKKGFSQQKTTFNQLNILNLPLLKNIREQIISILNKHNLLLTNNWAQLYNKDDEHGLHTHPSSIYSGIIYVESNGNDGTVFYHPISKMLESLGERFTPKIIEKFKSNTLILFPSFIPHKVLKQNENNNRLIISFNTSEKNNG